MAEPQARQSGTLQLRLLSLRDTPIILVTASHSSEHPNGPLPAYRGRQSPIGEEVVPAAAAASPLPPPQRPRSQWLQIAMPLSANPSSASQERIAPTTRQYQFAQKLHRPCANRQGYNGLRRSRGRNVLSHRYRSSIRKKRQPQSKRSQGQDLGESSLVSSHSGLADLAYEHVG